MRFIVSIVLWVVMTCPVCFAQSSKIDSLTTIWEDITQADSVRYEAGLDKFMLQFRKNLDTARQMGFKILKFTKGKQNLKWEATALRFIGNSYAVQGRFQEALDYFVESHELVSQLSDKKEMATTLNNIGTIYYELGNYPLALTNLLQCHKLSEEIKDEVGLARVTNNLGNVYIRQDNNEKALQYYTQSLTLKEQLGNKRSLPAAYNNIGLVYTNLENHDRALEYLMKSANIAKENDDKISESRAYNNIGHQYSLNGEFGKARDVLNKGIEIKKAIDDQEGLATAYLYRGENYILQKKFNLAKNDCEKSLAFGLKNGALIVQKEACKCLSDAWEKIGNTSKSLAYYKQFVQANDSLFNQKKTEEITRSEMQYTFEKQQLADSIAFTRQKAEQELAFEKDLNEQRNKLNLFIFGGLALVFLGGFYWNAKEKNKKLEHERTVVERLKQVDALKDQFLANTSHELRTPLNGIIGLSESLKDGVAGDLPSLALENLNLIANSGRRLSHLVNDILDFSKLKNQDIELSLSPTDVHSIAKVVLGLSTPLIQDKNLQLINSISPNAPLVDADENRLQQILYNLIGNAIKFTDKGYITLLSEEKNGMLSISVSDTGIGISKEKLDTIFNSFEQGDGRTERTYGGTGLGLSVSKQLVILHGGNIEVSSELGKGSIFTITLPLSKEQERSKIQKGIKIQPLRREDATKNSILKGVKKEEVLIEPKKVNIMIVDDEHVNRRVLQNHLSVAGYGVTEANSGKEALALLGGETNYDLILLDIMMPEMSGYEVCQKIRERYQTSELPIILLTAKNAVSELVQGFNSGANDYLTKPFSKNELLSRLKTHINLNNIHRATSKFVPAEFIKSVGRDSITDVMLGDHIEKNVTVLFTDVRDYTQLSEQMTPEQNFKFVNAYVGRMGPIIQQNKGFVNQYLGDGIMALFPHEAEHALDSAIEMQRTLALYNKRRAQKGYRPLAVGMGLHTGPLVMGIIGDIKRNDTAIISDTVNSASRVEGVTKHYGANIIISESSLQTIPNVEDFNFRYLGKVMVKGKAKSLGIYECIDGDSSESIALKIATKVDYEKGLDHFFNNKFQKAIESFDKVLNKNPNDQVVKYFIIKATEYTNSGVPKDWEVINTMNEK